MTQYDLIALMPGTGPSKAPDGIRLVAGGGHVAVLGRGRLLPAMGRPGLLRATVERARILEQLMQHGTVLPVMPGNRLAPGEVEGAVTANLPLLTALAERLLGRVQYQLTLRWQAERAVAHFGRPSGIVDSDAARHVIAADLRAEIDERLAALGGEVVGLPVANDLLYNVALLLDRAALPALDAAVEDIDAIWIDGFAIRLVGPFPAVSFASLHFERVEPKVVGRALADFGLSPGFSEPDLQAARRAAMMQADPARRETLRWRGEVLAGLLRRGGTAGPVHLARVWSEGMAEPDTTTTRAA